MTADELTSWALANGWKVRDGRPSLAKPHKPGEAVVRLTLKATVVHVEIRKPAGTWEKVGGASYGDIAADEQDGSPRGLGLDRIPSLSKLMQDNRDAFVFG